MKKILFVLLLSIFSLQSFAENNKILNFPHDMEYLTSLVGEKKTLKFFVPKNSDIVKYFKQVDGYEKSINHIYKLYMYYGMKDYPPLSTLKSIEPFDNGYNIVIDITNSKKDFYILNEKKTQYVKYTYNYGYVTDVDIGFVLDGKGKDLNKQSIYLMDLIEDYFYSNKYSKSSDFTKLLTSFEPWSYNYKNTYRKDDSLVVVKFKDFGSYAAQSVVNVSLQSVKFNRNREKIIEAIEKEQLYDKY